MRTMTTSLVMAAAIYASTFAAGRAHAQQQPEFCRNGVPVGPRIDVLPTSPSDPRIASCVNDIEYTSRNLTFIVSRCRSRQPIRDYEVIMYQGGGSTQRWGWGLVERKDFTLFNVYDRNARSLISPEWVYVPVMGYWDDEDRYVANFNQLGLNCHRLSFHAYIWNPDHTGAPDLLLEHERDPSWNLYEQAWYSKTFKEDHNTWKSDADFCRGLSRGSRFSGRVAACRSS